MATKKTRRVRIASPAIYADSPVAQRYTPEQRAANAGEAFALSDGLRTFTRGQLGALSGGQRFPTNARYWVEHSPQRLRSAIPLRGESRARAKQRAARARSFFASVARRRVERTEWRIVVRGTIERQSQGEHESFSGTNYGPWQPVPAGGLTNAMIRTAYLDLARNTVAVQARHAPRWEQETYTSEGFRRYRAAHYEEGGTLYLDSADIEIRTVAQ